MHLVDAKGLLSQSGGMNIYRGCTHGCIYCDSRSTCYGMKHDFEDVEVKQNAPELLLNALSNKRRRCMIGTGAMCDPYTHCEKQLLLTRRCLEIIDRMGYGLAIQTKSDLILRDLDLLKSINQKAKCVVEMTLTTFDEQLCRIVEPHVCTTRRRHEVLLTMRENGIIRPDYTSGSGRFTKNVQNGPAVMALLERIGVKFEAGNDAVRGGITGNYIKIKTKIER